MGMLGMEYGIDILEEEDVMSSFERCEGNRKINKESKGVLGRGNSTNELGRYK